MDQRNTKGGHDAPISRPEMPSGAPAPFQRPAHPDPFKAPYPTPERRDGGGSVSTPTYPRVGPDGRPMKDGSGPFRR